ncbi:hypothetical protein ES703_87801 [subsurface metagenome]
MRALEIVYPAQFDGPVRISNLVHFREYVQVLSQLAEHGSVCREMYMAYAKAWTRLFSLHWECLSPRSVSCIMAQLLTGCRVSSLPGLVISQAGSLFTLSLPRTKGGLATMFEYENPPPSLIALLALRSSWMDPISYWQYRRELAAANPNIFSNRPSGYLGCTHLFRYFFVQVLHHVLGMSLPELTKLMGWRSEDSVESYVDSSIFFSS